MLGQLRETATHLESAALFNGEEVGEGLHHFSAERGHPDDGVRGGDGARPTLQGLTRRRPRRLRRHPPVHGRQLPRARPRKWAWRRVQRQQRLGGRPVTGLPSSQGFRSLQVASPICNLEASCNISHEMFVFVSSDQGSLLEKL